MTKKKSAARKTNAKKMFRMKNSAKQKKKSSGKPGRRNEMSNLER